MRLQRAFLLSLYLTLVLACACLSYAVQPYLPELAYLTWAVMGLFAVGFVIEGRWSLSSLGANLLAVTIAAGAGLWVAYRLVEPPKGRVDLAILSAPLLPHLGALLIVLLVVKLFRPKQTADYWWLYSIAFMAVALACVLDSGPWFGLLLAGYLACAIWSLTLFYLERGQRRNPAAEPAARVPWPLLGLRLVGRRTLLVGGIALVLFLVTPRLVSTPWAGNPLRPTTNLGEPGIDLNRRGTVQLNTQVAFTLEARDAQGRPLLDLDRDLHFRGMTLNSYSRGSWAYRSTVGGASQSLRGPQQASALADLGPEQITLTYTYTYRPRHRLVLAEPIVQAAEPDRVTVVSLTEENTAIPWMRQPTGELLPPVQPRGRCRYVQVTRPLADQDRPAVHLTEEQMEHLCRYHNLPGLEAWTAERLAELVAQGQLQADDLKRLPDGSFSSSVHEKLARALEAYLARSGEYSYSLELERLDPDLDPVLDFLWNVKRGHCQHFASALAVMLRSQGIASRIVLGFRGVEPQEDGTYLVRHSQAHAWVEALVARRGTDGKWRRHWLPLEPTPAGPVEEADSPLVRWLQDLGTRADALWHAFVLDYHAERQAAALQSWDPVVAWLAGGVTLAAGLLLLRRRWRRRPAVVPASSDPLLAELLAVLARRCRLMPTPAQTPLEFAGQAGQVLPAPFQHLPEEVARLHYRRRYGGEPIPEPEADRLRRCLTELDRLLAASPAVANGPAVG